MINVIQINPADGEVAELFNGRGRFDVGKNCRLWFKGKRNKAGETAGLVLKPAQLA